MLQTEETAQNKSMLVKFSPAVHSKTHKGDMVKLMAIIFTVTKVHLSSLQTLNRVLFKFRKQVQRRIGEC